MERDFKGVWIPKEIWLNMELTLLEKAIYIEIDSLDNENHCTASNAYLAEFCNCSESRVTTAINHLQKLGMLEILAFDGRHRKIRVVKRTSQPSKKNEADYEKERPINIYNNTNNKKTLSKDKVLVHSKLSKTISSKTSGQEFLELYHKHCPNLPKVKSLTDSRVKAIQHIMKQFNKQDIIQVLDLANSSRFLTGNNDRGWKANIDFILREDKFVSILEGKYNDNKSNLKKGPEMISGAQNRIPRFENNDDEITDKFKQVLRKEGKKDEF